MKLKNCTKNILEKISKINSATTHICKGKDYVFPFFRLDFWYLEIYINITGGYDGKEKEEKEEAG